RKISYDGDVIIEIYKNNFDDVTELMRSADKLSKLL
ncbi:MAG: sugar phosphate isomerase/epimerase, partial [Ruminococcaceae bacterium]|nr:sugar phosphate isomerase/epimerase [Oscillospiraceae bacterium]